MTTDHRDLITRMAKELDNYRQLLLDDRTVTHRLSDEARAALADEPAVPQGREPAAVTGQPNWRGLCEELVDAWLKGDDIVSAMNRARAVLARWGTSNLTQTWRSPADGEVAELVAEIRHFLAGYQQMRGLDPEHIYSIHRGDKMEAHITVSRLTRAAELLQRQVLVPVAVSDALIKAECALSDIAEGEPMTDEGDPLKWAERRCADTLAIIRPTMMQHKIRASEWPPVAATAKPLPEVGE